MEKQTKQTSPAKYQPTDEQVAKWKKQFPDGVHYYESADGEYAAVLRAPDRNVISVAAMESGGDPIKNVSIIVDNVWLGGDEALRKEDRYFLGLQKHVDSLLDIKQGTLRKL